MSASATASFKPPSMMTDSSRIFSFPFIFISKQPVSRCQCLSVSAKQPIKLHLSYSHVLSPLCLKSKTHFSFTTTPFVAQTSDWAPEREEEDGTSLALTESEQEGEEEPSWENEKGDDSEARISDFEEPEGEDASIEAIGESGKDGEFGEEDFVEPPEEAKLYVGNLPYDVDSENLAMLFDKAGTVEVAEVIYNRATDTSRGFGFVTMSTVEEAERAEEMFHRYDLEGRLLTVNKASPRGSKPERPPRVFEARHRIYVGNLPWDVDDSRLEQLFSEHGKVVSARVVFDRETGRSRGFGFVTMSSETELNDAIAALDGQNLDGRAIRVNVAEERPRRMF